ncbi:alpha/beta hydrolase [Nocardia macrotermitis]|uniref:Acetyl esterase n=1 Tax=Nocardia macrotermitis TaxID=2585198 RepID=A0A7K0DBS8_9NOCA|nr:alpha/beta hydrolase [Nocardia macrotermitis]MQY23177.1 Acetyl esterase [Nocardia macrotermitis]
MSNIAQATAGERRAAHRARKEPLAPRLASAAAWLLCIVVIVGGAIFFAPRIPVDWLQDVVGAAGLALSAATLWFAVGCFLCVVVAIVSWRSRKVWRLAAGVIAAALALTVVLVPWLTAWRTASAHGSTVSVFSFSDQGPHRSPTRTTTFATIDGQALDLDVYRPTQPAAGAPAIVFVHGGGFVNGNRGESNSWFSWLATQGVTVFSIDYRLAPPARWQQATGDVKCALGWVRAHAGEFGIASSNISVAGDSAGGNLALMAAYTVGDAQFPPTCEVPEAPVRSVIALYPITNLPAALDDTRTPYAIRTMLDRYTGGRIAQQRDRYLAASPTEHVAPGLPPTLLVQGGSDHLVPANQTTRLATALNAAGVPVQTYELPWVDHGFLSRWGDWGSQLLRPQLSKFVQQYLTAAS